MSDFTMLNTAKATLQRHVSRHYPLEAYGLLVGTCSNEFQVSLSVGSTSIPDLPSDRFATLPEALDIAGEMIADSFLSINGVYHAAASPASSDGLSIVESYSSLGSSLPLYICVCLGGEFIWDHSLFVRTSESSFLRSSIAVVPRQRRHHVVNGRKLINKWTRLWRKCIL